MALRQGTFAVESSVWTQGRLRAVRNRECVNRIPPRQKLASISRRGRFRNVHFRRSLHWPHSIMGVGDHSSLSRFAECWLWN
jgi:hypothetical protein